MATPERYDVTKKLEEDSQAGTSGAGGKQPTRRCLYVLLAVSLLIMLSLAIALIVLLAIGPTTKAVPTNYYQGTQKLTNHVQPKRPEKVTKSRSKSASGVQPTTAPEKVELTVGSGRRSTEASKGTVSTTASPTTATRVTDKPAQGQGQGQARPTGRTTVTPPPSPTTTASPAQPRVTPTSARNRTAHEQTTNQTASQTTTAPPRGRNGTGAGGKASRPRAGVLSRLWSSISGWFSSLGSSIARVFSPSKKAAPVGSSASSGGAGNKTNATAAGGGARDAVRVTNSSKPVEAKAGRGTVSHGNKKV